MAPDSHTSGHKGATLSTRAWVPASLPYQKAADARPSPLPSAQEIRDSTAIISQRSGQTISAPTPEIVVKWGLSTTVQEGKTLLYLEQCVPNVPAPRLYAMYRGGHDLFIVMQRIPGRSLEAVWPELSERDKDSLTVRLRGIFDDLRRAPCPRPSFFGAVDGGRVAHIMFYSDPSDPVTSGPFSSEEAFTGGFIEAHRHIVDLNDLPCAKLDFYSAHLGNVFSGHKAVLTHSDVQRKNILVSSHAVRDRGNDNDCDINIVDWKDSGWYPDYWEYAVAFSGWFWRDDWSTRFAQFVSPWPAEAAMLKTLHNDMFFPF